MGVSYWLINRTKKEVLSYGHLPVGKAKEIAGNSVSSSITSWYLLKNMNNDITFIPDQYQSHQFDLDWIKAKDFEDVTEKIIAELIQENILKDDGFDFIDSDEPNIYIRKLENVWNQNI